MQKQPVRHTAAGAPAAHAPTPQQRSGNVPDFPNIHHLLFDESGVMESADLHRIARASGVKPALGRGGGSHGDGDKAVSDEFLAGFNFS